MCRAADRGRRLATVVLAPLALAAPASAEGATIEVVGDELRVDVPQVPAPGVTSGAMVLPLAGGGARVSLHNVAPEHRSAGAACQPASNPAPMTLPGGSLLPADFAADCNLAGVTKLDADLLSSEGPQVFMSTLALATNVTAPAVPAASGSFHYGDLIVTGDGADTITAGGGNDRIEARGVGEPPAGVKDPVNVLKGNGGNDTFVLDGGGAATGSDDVLGGAGIDLATYAGRFASGFPGQDGVRVTLDGTANDGDPALTPLGHTTAGERDNVRTDVEQVTGTRREDRLIGSAANNRLEGLESEDVLTGAAGADTIVAREPGGAGAGVRDVVSCGSPGTTSTTSFGFTAFPTLPTQPASEDQLVSDLADPRPVDCEQIDEAPVREGPNVRWAPKAARTRAGLRLTFTCPREAGRTCAGGVKAAGTRGDLGPAARFSIKRGRRGKVAIPLGAATRARLAGRAARVRLVAVEKGRFGTVTTVGFAAVPRR